MNGGNIGGGTVSGTLYVSFLAKSNRLSRDWLGQIVTGTYSAPAPSGQGIATSFAGFQLYRGATEALGIGESGASSNYSIFSTGGAGGNDADIAPAVRVNNATRLFVAKITFNSSALDNIQVWLDPNSSLTEAAQTGASVIKTAWNDFSFTRIAYRSGSSNNDGSVDFDEVRMGTTWASVLPQTPNPATAGVAINEFAASNTGIIRDEDGDASDWIELYNGSASPVTLDGLYLSDSAAQPTRWQFPDTTPDRVLNPGQHLIVWASKQRRRQTPLLHGRQPAPHELRAEHQHRRVARRAQSHRRRWHHAHRLRADDILAVPERTASLLTSWQSGPAETVESSRTTNDATGITTIQARSTQPYTGLSIEFLRLSVTIP